MLYFPAVQSLPNYFLLKPNLLHRQWAESAPDPSSPAGLPLDFTWGFPVTASNLRWQFDFISSCDCLWRTQRHCPAHTQLCMCSCLLIPRCPWRRKKTHQSSSSIMPVPLSPSSSRSLPSRPPILPSRAPTVGFTNCRRGCKTLLPLFRLSTAIWFTSLPLAIICSFCPFFPFSPSYSSVSLHPCDSIAVTALSLLPGLFLCLLRSFSFTACP